MNCRWVLMIVFHLAATQLLVAQNVGIGTTSPKARLHVADSAVLFTGPATIPTTTDYPPPASGAGTRMMWYPQKAAFRAGFMYYNYWDKDSIGLYSFATGVNTKALGNISTSLGNNTFATGNASTSMGNTTFASGNGSTTMGNSTYASGTYSVSMGANTFASGFAATSMGVGTRASGEVATTMGFGTKAKSNYSVAIGKYNDSTAGPDERLFEIGNGTDENTRSNALTVLTNGNVGLGIATPAFPLHFKPVLGDKIALWGNSGPHYGIGVQSQLLQIHSDVSISDIAFGYGSSTTFTETMRIKGNGNVGIGTAIPPARFSVSVSGQPLDGTAMSSAFSINAGQLGSTVSNEISIASLGYKGNNNVALGIRGYRHTAGTGWENGSILLSYDVDNTVRAGGNTAFLALSAYGNLGIGNVNPLRPISFPAIGGEKILLYPGINGEVGIGVYPNELRIHSDNPGAKVSFGTQDNAGVFTEVGFFQKSGAYALTVNGNIWANGTTYASDARFKKNIEPLDHALEKILQLNGVSYQMKAGEFPEQQFDTAHQVGLLAQEVEKIVPEVVSTAPTGYKAIDYAKLVPLLIEAIKSQQAQIERQQKEIDSKEDKRPKK